MIVGDPIGMTGRVFPTSRHVKAMARFHLGIATHLFVHIPKNGGLAIRNYRPLRRRLIFSDPYFLRDNAYRKGLVAAMVPKGMQLGANHARLRDVRADARARLQPVAVVRNPFSRTFSRFTYGQKRAERLGQPVDYSPKAFEQFLERRHETANRPYYWHRAINGWYPQLDYVVDEDAQIKCHILRQEMLSDELSRYFGIEALPRLNASGRTAPHYSEVYSDKARQIVADWYAKDIDTFGFDFTGGATRNCHYTDEP